MARSKYEIRAQKMLERDGYTVDYKIRPRIVPQNYNVDFLGLFDLLAYKKSESVLRMISIKSASNASTDHQTDIELFSERVEGVSPELWRFDRDPKDKRCLRCRVWKYNLGKRLDTLKLNTRI